MRKEEIMYSFTKGYHNGGDNVDVPVGSLIYPSTNVIYTKTGKPISVKDYASVTSAIANSGGSRAFTLDSNLVGIMGLNTTTQKAIGNMLQSIGRSIWFVGNTIEYSFTVPAADIDAGTNVITETGHGMSD